MLCNRTLDGRVSQEPEFLPQSDLFALFTQMCMPSYPRTCIETNLRKNLFFLQSFCFLSDNFKGGVREFCSDKCRLKCRQIQFILVGLSTFIKKNFKDYFGLVLSEKVLRSFLT